jgi:hypothetical protein
MWFTASTRPFKASCTILIAIAVFRVTFVPSGILMSFIAKMEEYISFHDSPFLGLPLGFPDTPLGKGRPGPLFLGIAESFAVKPCFIH